MSGAKFWIPLPLALTIIGLVSPSELSLFIGSLRLPPHRLILIIFFVCAIVKLLRDQPIRLAWYDGFFALYNIWILAIYIYHEGGGNGIEFGGSQAVESFAAYFIARIYIRDARAFRATLAFLFASMVIVALIAFPEALFGRHYAHEFFRTITGYLHPIGYETRLGLTRAYSTFDHPILYGSFAASLFALVWFTNQGGPRVVKIGLVSGAVFLSLSSAPILCVLVQVTLIAWDRITRGISRRVAITVVLLAALFGIVEMISDRSALEAIVTRITLDPWTAFYRIQIWTHGLESVAAHPWLGIGLSDWARAWWMVSSSVDAFWLVIMMRTGLPSLLLLVLAIGLLVRAVHTSPATRDNKEHNLVALGWTMSMLALSLAAFTVHYWNAMHAYYFFLLGMGGWLADPIRSARRVRQMQKFDLPMVPVQG